MAAPPPTLQINPVQLVRNTEPGAFVALSRGHSLASVEAVL